MGVPSPYQKAAPPSSSPQPNTDDMAEQLVLRGTLEGHSGWVTSLATSLENPNMLLSASRDRSLIVWNLTRDETSYGYPKRALKGHNHIVSDCVISSDGAYALSASCDKTIKLWNTLGDCKYPITDKGHTEWVSCVRF